MEKLIILKGIIVNIDEIQALTYRQNGSYWSVSDCCEQATYDFLLCLKGQKPISIPKKDYYELKEKIEENTNGKD